MVSAFVAPTASAATDDPKKDDRKQLVSGVEGSKAALVRIEVSATTEIVHVDHTTGEVQLSRGRYEIPVAVATGVITSADGVIATANDNLIIDEREVGVYAANLLFGKKIRVRIVGNHGDPALRGHTNHPYWKDHLQHCYDREEHCILFVVPNYKVFTYTSPASMANAELVNKPDAPDDVALLQVGGGGGMPTARLVAGNADAKDGELIGFTARPDATAKPDDLAVTVNAASAHVTAKTPLTSALHKGLSGGPVVDPKSGAVVGLVFLHARSSSGDTGAQFIAAREVRRAMDAAKTSASPSQFDAVFRRGVDQLATSDSPASATGSLKESRTYYPSALAAQHLRTAQESRERKVAKDGGSGAVEDTKNRSAGWLPGGGWMTVAALVLVLLASGALLVRGRKKAQWRPRRGRGTNPPSPSRPSVMAGAAPNAADSRRPAASTSAGPRAQGRSGSYCTNCGEQLPSNARFCGNCGEPVR